MRRPLVAALLLTISALALGACGGSSTGSSSVTQKGLYGKLPPSGHADAWRHDHLRAGERLDDPELHLPDRPFRERQHQQLRVAADRCTCRSTTTSPIGSYPGVHYALSIANKPVFSDGNKTVTIQLKKGYKWNDGKPVDAQDVLFDIALIKAAVGESAANWGSFTPGYFPQKPREHQRDRASTRWSCISSGPSTRASSSTTSSRSTSTRCRARTGTSPPPDGPHLNWKVPANAKKIYDYLGKAGGQVGNFGATRCGRSPTARPASELQPRHGLVDAEGQPELRRHPEAVRHTIQGITYTGITPMLNAMRTGTPRYRIGRLLPAHRRFRPQVPGLQRVRATRLRLGRRDLELQGQVGPLRQDHPQLYFRQAMAMLVDQPAIIAGIYHGAAGPAYGPVPSVPKTPVYPGQRRQPRRIRTTRQRPWRR